ncbi:MAG TPA: biotin carboxylase N-terminal domain-containing protein [Acidimicrobiia bacterium]|nr:biotin carboxylase N-terminal domain-containing protein [Acidimicrobiia bacterium]
MPTSIRTLLVANRGEVARRVFRTCRQLGIRTVAVYSPPDAGAPFVAEADAAVPLDGVRGYLDIEQILAAAESTGADAVHPGWGFLAENAALARACTAAGLVWIGPPPEAMESMGSKIEARRLMESAGVPVVPGATLSSSPDGLDEAAIVAAGERVGFPLLVKASAGGGGKGMRLATRPEDLVAAVADAAREAAAAFGDPAVFLERYVSPGRHVEVQVIGDHHGTVVHLFERDCSVQRRHQKLVEEAPSPAVDDDLRARMGQAAVAAAEAVGYHGVGTVEFLLGPDGAFYFLEMNTRLQVEHPVTELVTGLDLVRLQLAVAEGRPLPAEVHGARISGHAVEVRLYAEDPRSFLPQAGRVERLRLPAGVRVDAGVAEGDEVGTAYDPLIAKLIAHAPTRTEALDRLAAALAETEVAGVVTNLPFLRWLVAHPAVRAGDTTTAFLTEHPPLSDPPLRLPQGPWSGSWRLNLPPPAPAPPPDVDAASHHHRGAAAEQSALTAPMPGTVIAVRVRPGDRVEARETLCVLEAMKMETPIVSPYEAVVRAVHVEEGDRVAGGSLLVELEE